MIAQMPVIVPQLWISAVGLGIALATSVALALAHWYEPAQRAEDAAVPDHALHGATTLAAHGVDVLERP